MEKRKYFIGSTHFGTVIWYDENGVRTSFNENPGNFYYEAYLEWLAGGNTPEVIDETS
jgi:hypothetical protein